MEEPIDSLQFVRFLLSYLHRGNPLYTVFLVSMGIDISGAGLSLKCHILGDVWMDI